RLFHDLQQLWRHARAHEVEAVEDDHVAPSLRGAERRPLNDLVALLDEEEGARGLEHAEVRVPLLADQPATPTFAAAAVGTQQRHGEGLRRVALSTSGRAHEE